MTTARDAAETAGAVLGAVAEVALTPRWGSTSRGALLPHSCASWDFRTGSAGDCVIGSAGVTDVQIAR